MERQLERFDKETLIEMYAKLARKYVAVADELRKYKEAEKKEE